MNQDEVANPGLLRPPLVYLTFGLLGFGAQLLWPWSMTFGLAGPIAGIVVMLLAIALLVLTLRLFRTNNTPFPGTRPTAAIISAGPFRFSRNPAYLAFSGMLFATSFLLQTYWLWLALLCAVITIDRVVIPREEHYLSSQFGDGYERYRENVRRWF